MSEHAHLECHNAQAMHNQLCSNAHWIAWSNCYEVKREREKGKERYPSFGPGLENFSGRITPAVLGKSRFTHDYCSYPSPLALNSELLSTAWPLFSTSWGNDSTWAAMLRGWEHCQCQSWMLHTAVVFSPQPAMLESTIAGLSDISWCYQTAKSHLNRILGGSLVQRDVLGNRD